MGLRRLLVTLTAATAMLAGLPPAATPASATHPCPASSSGGAPAYDAGVSSDHDACSSPPSPQPGDVVLRESDGGATVTVPVGGRLFVQLTSGWTGPLWTDLTGGQALHRTLLDVQRPSTTAVFVPGRTSDGEQVVASGGPTAWAATVVVVAATDPQASPSPTDCRPVPWNGSGTLSDGDNGRTVTVARGDVVVVAFAGCSGADYQPATADGPLVRYRAHGDNPGAARSIFAATAVGSATITATTDARCLHASPSCAIPQRVWSATVHVVEACELSGPPAVASGDAVQLSGRAAPSTPVQVWLRRRGATEFVARRQLSSDPGGFFATSYIATDDYRWYATSGDCTTASGLTAVTPTVSGPATAGRGAVVSLAARGPAGAAVQLWMRSPGGAFARRRTGSFDSSGTYRASYVATTDQRYYVVTGPDHRLSPQGLTQLR